MILIVDPDKEANQNVVQSFKNYGFKNIEIAKSAAAAKEVVVQADRVTLIIINHELDDGDAYHLSRELRDMEAAKEAYIYIVISSLNNKTAIEKIKHSSADNYIVKPYMSADFQKLLLPFMLSRVVLVIEDDPVIQMMVVNILSRYPVEVIAIDDGMSARNHINTTLPVKLTLLDIKLPNMNGIQLLKQIRSKSAWRNTSVVMLTSSSDSADVKTSLSSGANDYITKPFKVDQFVSRINRFLGNED